VTIIFIALVAGTGKRNLRIIAKAMEWRWNGDGGNWGEMKAPSGKFGRKKEEAIAALLTQRNIEEAARVAGIGTNTLLRWLKVPEIQTAYREARRAAFSQSVARLQQGATAAATTMLKLMVDPNTPASVRIRAAESIMNHGTKAIEIEDIEVRVAELERASQMKVNP
jgi:hypothetical protein